MGLKVSRLKTSSQHKKQRRIMKYLSQVIEVDDVASSISNLDLSIASSYSNNEDLFDTRSEAPNVLRRHSLDLRHFSDPEISQCGARKMITEYTVPSHFIIRHSKAKKRKISDFIRRFVGYYELREILAEGRIGQVRRGVHALTKSEAAIRIIRKDSLEDIDMSKIERELIVLRQIEHPYIIRYLHAHTDDEHIYFFHEYAGLGDMKQYIIDNDRLTESETRYMFWQICIAIEFLHDRGIAHRNLTLENVMIGKEKRVKISDFGRCSFFGECISVEDVPNVEYSSPEVIRKLEHDVYAADIWSLGIILYAMSTGSLPFEGSSDEERSKSIFRGQFRVPFFMSNDLESLIKNMLLIKPPERPSIEQVRMTKWMEMENCFIKIENNDKGYFAVIHLDEIPFIIKLGIRIDNLKKMLGKKLIRNPKNQINNAVGEVLAKLEKTPVSRLISRYREKRQLRKLNEQEAKKKFEEEEMARITDSLMGYTCYWESRNAEKRASGDYVDFDTSHWKPEYRVWLHDSPKPGLRDKIMSKFLSDRRSHRKCRKTCPITEINENGKYPFPVIVFKDGKFCVET